MFLARCCQLLRTDRRTSVEVTRISGAKLRRIPQVEQCDEMPDLLGSVHCAIGEFPSPWIFAPIGKWILVGYPARATSPDENEKPASDWKRAFVLYRGDGKEKEGH